MAITIKIANPPTANFAYDLKKFNGNKTGEWVKVSVPKQLNKRRIWFTAFYDGNLVNETFWYNGELCAFNKGAKRWSRPWGICRRDGAVTPVYDDNGAGLSRSTLISFGDETIFPVADATSGFQRDVACLQKFNVFRKYVAPIDIMVDAEYFCFNCSDHRNPVGLTTFVYLAVESMFGML